MKDKKIIIVLVSILVISVVAIVCIVTFNNKDKKINQDADIVFSLNADKTKIKAGDTVTISLDLDKVPANGLGVCAFNATIIYDSSKLSLNIKSEEEDYIAYDSYAGNVGKKFLMRDEAITEYDYNKEKNEKGIVLIAAVAAQDAVNETGNVYTITFKANEDINIKENGLYLKTNEDGEYDFVAAGVKITDDNLYDVNSDLKYVLKNNI